MFGWRHCSSQNPRQQIGVADPEKKVITIKLVRIETGKIAISKAAKQGVHFLHAGITAAIEQSLAAMFEGFIHGCSVAAC